MKNSKTHSKDINQIAKMIVGLATGQEKHKKVDIKKAILKKGSIKKDNN